MWSPIPQDNNALDDVKLPDAFTIDYVGVATQGSGVAC